jgi:mannose-6-phosphate isomerase
MGFKPFPEILKTLLNYPELGNFIGQEICNTLNSVKDPSPLKQRELVRLMFSTLVQRSILYEQELTQSLDELARRLGKSSNNLKEEEEIFLTLRERYPGADVGLFAMFLFNLIHLKPGQGVFTKAGVPHAYLEGNIVECMANSDNVVRVGLTPKYKDAEALLTILDYAPGPISLLEGRSDVEEIVYHTPVSEFQVSRWNMKPHTERRERTEGVSNILLITKGEIHINWNEASENGTDVFRQGQAFFIPACLQEFQVQAKVPVEIFKVEVPHLLSVS